MSDDYIKVNFSGMDGAQANFHKVWKAYDTILRNLDASIRKDLDLWEGQARAAYTEAQAQWTAAGTRMGGAVQQLGKAIGDSNDRYRTGETGIAGMWRA